MFYQSILKNLVSLSIVIVLISTAIAVSSIATSLSISNAPTMYVTETAEIYVTQTDTAKLSFTFSKVGTSASEVQNEVSSTVTEVYNELQNKWSMQQKDITTTSFNVSPNYTYTRGKREISGYKVAHSTNIIIRELDNVSDILTYITSKNPTDISDLTFELDEQLMKELQNQAIAEAIQKAREKAKGIALDAGISLGKILDISTNNYGTESLAELNSARAFTASQKIPVSSGTRKISATAIISYEIK